MAAERGGRRLAVLAMVISLIALGISILTYREVGGSLAWKERLQALQSTLEAAQKETADALARIEGALRPAERSENVSADSKR